MHFSATRVNTFADESLWFNFGFYCREFLHIHTEKRIRTLVVVCAMLIISSAVNHDVVGGRPHLI